MSNNHLSVEGSLPPQSYLVAMRALQIENELLKSSLASSQSKISEISYSLKELKSIYLASQKQLLDNQIIINNHLRQISELKQKVVILQEQSHKYQIIIEQKQRDKQNINNKITERIINDQKMYIRNTLSQNKQDQISAKTTNWMENTKTTVSEELKEICILPCVLSLKTPPKPLKSSILKESSSKSIIGQSNILISDSNENENDYPKLIKNLVNEKKKLLILMKHEIRKLQRQMQKEISLQQGQKLKKLKQERQLQKYKLESQIFLLQSQ